MAQRYIDWLRNLTAKSTTIDGTEQIHIDSSGLSQKALLSDVLRYGGGNSTRVTTIGNANIHQNSTGAMWLEVAGQTAGNARGAGAFDISATRTSATAVASGANAFAFGINPTASAANSVAFGYFPVSANKAQFSVGYAPAAGQAQANIQTLYTVTTDATLTPLNITNTATDRLVIPATRLIAFTGMVVAMCNVSSSSNFAKSWQINGTIIRDTNNTTRLVGTPTITVLGADSDGIQTPSTWAISSITADDTNEALAVNVTGQTGQTIRWVASLFYGQVGF